VHACFALDEALDELADDGGWQVRRDRYRRRTARVRDGFATLGITALLAPEDSAGMLTTFRLPEGVSYPALHDGLKRAGFVIYAGQGHLAGGIFRIATMGAIEDRDLDRLVLETSRLLRGGA
jgi:2-aminoethylphosphonate-pyruvate transaminase